MAVIIPESANGTTKRHFLRLCFILALILSFGLPIPDALAGNTGCTVIFTGGAYKTPQQAPGIECPGLAPPAPPPASCLPNACKFDPAAQTYTNCPPITQCVDMGEDPPVSSPLWDESFQGYSAMGANIVSGKCGPPNPNNVNAPYPAGCTAGTGTTTTCYPVLNCPPCGPLGGTSIYCH
jgi:hypothetical protein